MGKSAGKAPDPVATAAAQGAANDDTARLNARLNRGTTISPWGKVVNRDVGNDQWETEVMLSGGQQQLYEDDTNTSLVTSRAALDSANRLSELLKAPVNTDGLRGMATEIGYRGDISSMAPEDYEASRTRVEQSILDRLRPSQQQDREALEGRLAAQGVGAGTDAYARAMDELNRSTNDARLAAVQAGGQEQSRLFGLDLSRLGFNNEAQAQAFGQDAQRAEFMNQARAQQLAEMLQLRSQPINEVSALFGLGNGVEAPSAAQFSSVASQSGDLQGAEQANYQARQQKAAAGNQAAAQGAAALATIAVAI